MIESRVAYAIPELDLGLPACGQSLDVLARLFGYDVQTDVSSLSQLETSMLIDRIATYYLDDFKGQTPAAMQGAADRAAVMQRFGKGESIDSIARDLYPGENLAMANDKVWRDVGMVASIIKQRNEDIHNGQLLDVFLFALSREKIKTTRAFLAARKAVRDPSGGIGIGGTRMGAGIVELRLHYVGEPEIADSSARAATNWQERAACRTADPDLFFPEPEIDEGAAAMNEKKALAICARCLVRAECLDFAIEQNIKFGVKGGLNEKDLRLERRRRQWRARSRNK